MKYGNSEMRIEIGEIDDVGAAAEGAEGRGASRDLTGDRNGYGGSD